MDSANSSHCKACSGLSPPRSSSCQAHTGNAADQGGITGITELTDRTVRRYTRCLTDCFMFHRIGRYDLVNGRPLNHRIRYSPADTGLIGTFLDKGRTDKRRTLEDVVYLELLRSGYGVHIGCSRDKDMGLIAEKDGEIEHYLVYQTIQNGDTFGGTIHSPDVGGDGHPKTILSLDTVMMDPSDGRSTGT